ncbi:norsolorinic acid reductase [Mytilinidion resinicola]|uniref:Norsolorinic acid reductase n=1 Tax=Mytilinidion resinicola TaxID=574789 RepID=A0A6A6YVE1_9PEZI|nr:norsolorinic acid reductase [Mytilinidion resinicola]KAF2812489.1 norsolorinic acid reductase [Mytilinidion resinicola]
MAIAFATAPPKSLLGRHRVLSPSASVRVSPLSLGTVNFGTACNQLLGKCTKDSAFAMLDHFYSLGGNFIDTANHYQSGQAELWVGEWLALRHNRDELVLATKFSSSAVLGTENAPEILSNYSSNSTMSLKHSLATSLARLGTSYIDVLYVHWWDFTTSVAELMRALNNVVQKGKVLYLGASNMPSWFVVTCNAYARQHGMATFVVYTGQWSAAERDLEREIFDICARRRAWLSRRGACSGVYPPTAAAKQVAEALRKIAAARKTAPTSIALAWAIQKGPYVFPIIGGRKLEHMKANIEALSIELTAKKVKEIEAAAQFDQGFPKYKMNFGGPFNGPQDLALMTGNYDYVLAPKAIASHYI